MNERNKWMNEWMTESINAWMKRPESEMKCRHDMILSWCMTSCANRWCGWPFLWFPFKSPCKFGFRNAMTSSWQSAKNRHKRWNLTSAAALLPGSGKGSWSRVCLILRLFDLLRCESPAEQWRATNLQAWMNERHEMNRHEMKWSWPDPWTF